MVLEDDCRNELRQYIKRGRVDAMIRVTKVGPILANQLDLAAVDLAVAAIRLIKQRCGDLEPIKAAELLAFENLRPAIQYNAFDVWPHLRLVLQSALLSLDERRSIEGVAVQTDLLQQHDCLVRGHELIVQRVPEMERTFQTTLRQRFTEVLGDQVNENRFLQEVAVLLARSSIHEEIERLSQHLASMKQLIETGGVVGKRLDFLAQEMHREVNTIGSKSSDIIVSTLIVDLKDAIDTIREQARNIE